jgi:3-hydroxybutyrate dehydrogenase
MVSSPMNNAPKASLAGRVTLVTGSDTGLGLCIVEALAREKSDVVIHGLGPRDAGEAIAARIAEETGVRTLFCGADLRNVAEIEAMMAEIDDQIGPVDILVNNAVVRHFNPIEEFTAEEWDMSLAVNVSAPFHLSRLVVAEMKRRGWGRIVNLSSIYGQRGVANRIDYVTTKTAMLGMTRGLAIELAQSGVTCNAVSPGTVPTNSILDKIRNLAVETGVTMAEAESAYLVGRNPTGRFVATESVVALVGLICSRAGNDINGANLAVDGGWSVA